MVFNVADVGTLLHQNGLIEETVVARKEIDLQIEDYNRSSQAGLTLGYEQACELRDALDDAIASMDGEG
jgi:hypothetical protein